MAVETKNFMERLGERLLEEDNELILTVCGLLLHGRTPTEIAEYLAAERAREEGKDYSLLPEKEQIRRLDQFKPYSMAGAFRW